MRRVIAIGKLVAVIVGVRVKVGMNMRGLRWIVWGNWMRRRRWKGMQPLTKGSWMESVTHIWKIWGIMGRVRERPSRLTRSQVLSIRLRLLGAPLRLLRAVLRILHQAPCTHQVQLSVEEDLHNLSEDRNHLITRRVAQ